jgi:predicted dithiol-disulfide oxidoreductase (DUF899 family)
METQMQTQILDPAAVQALAPGHEVVSPELWLAARRRLLEKEKEFTRLRDELSRQRRELPWERVDPQYVFEGLAGRESLADLFDGRSQLIVYHFMFGPEWREGCPSCSMVADHLQGSLSHIAQRDVSLAVVSRARFPQIEEFRQRMGWSFRWVSSYANDFNRDFGVSFTPEEKARGKMPYNYGFVDFPSDEAHGVSVFCRNPEGEIFHTYSTYARGAEELLGVYGLLDLTPKGRDEDGLPFPMAWVRHQDRYDRPETVKVSECCAAETSA